MKNIYCSNAFSNSQQNNEIVFYNMDFGDSFLLKSENDCLLVDCGTLTKNKEKQQYMAELVFSHMKSSRRRNLLITHYHADHFCCIPNLHNLGITFDNIYIRCLNKKRLKFDYYSAFTELCLYAKRSGDFKSLLTWFLPASSLVSILSNGGFVRGLNSDRFSKFSFGHLFANVLWPTSKSRKHMSGTKSLFLEMQSIASKVEKYIFYNMNDPVCIHIKKAFEMCESLNKLLCLEGAISKNRIFEIAHDLLNDEKNLTEEEIKNYLKKFKLPKKVKDSLSDMENHLSIVFEINSDLLMCGDADEYAMDSAMKKFVGIYPTKQISDYCIVKVPHHGTTPYYYQFNDYFTPIYLIPNSKRFSNSSNWDIDLRYTGTLLCHSLNNSYTTACQSARSKKCLCCSKGIVDYLTFVF